MTDTRRPVLRFDPAKRLANLPKPTYPDDLPVVQKRQVIADAIAQHQVVVVCGETGSGKTTQLPKICLELGRGVKGLIGHTQPRRIAARSLAARIASELQTPLGQAVGYKVRFDDKLSDRTYIKVMTDGILLAETQADRDLRQYDTILIDEAHERSLNVDFLLGYLKKLLPRRPDLKLIITSATIDPQRFADFFADAHGRPAPIVEVSGRTYPVEVRYRPLTTDDPEQDDLTQQQAILQAVDELMEEGGAGRVGGAGGGGDILVFLPGEREIRETTDWLKQHPFGQRLEVLPLYARLSTMEQQRIFKPHAHRRVVLATNVAETSLTVPGIRYVIDPGLARISRYSSRRKVQRLPIEPIAQASADQRKGRCGRVSDGICIRLFSQQDYDSRPRFTEPEIQRTNLASVILQMKALNLGRIEDFPFIDAPSLRTVRDGYATLFELGAVDEQGKITPLGRKLARLPVDPRIGRMVLAADQEHVLSEVLVIASALSVQDPRDRPMDQQQQADAAHARFADPVSDFLSYLRIWDFYQHLTRTVSRSQVRKACRANFLSYLRMREWLDVHRQLRKLAIEAGMRINRREVLEDGSKQPDDQLPPVVSQQRSDAVHRALLTGLLANLAVKGDGPAYAGGQGKEIYIFPGSALFKKSPRWIMAAELVQTTRLFARTVGPVQPQWIEPLAGHLLKRQYSEPQWDPQAGSVMAFEKVTLFGLTIVPRRRVSFGRVQPTAAREMFIQCGLVEADWERLPGAIRQNRQVIAQVRALEAKCRRQDALVDDDAIRAFYDARLPEQVHSGPLLVRWLKKQAGRHPLHMRMADVVRQGQSLPSLADYPDVCQVFGPGGIRLPLRYVYKMGSPEDGVTATVPLAVLNQLEPPPFDWLVPGWLGEKVEALLRSLPKQVRRLLVPIPQFAQQAAEQLRQQAVASGDQAAGDGVWMLPGIDLAGALARIVGQRVGYAVSPDAFAMDQLPDHLRMNFQVVDEKGACRGRGRDLAALQRELGSDAAASFAAHDDPAWQRDGITRWDFGDLPSRVRTRYAGRSVEAYPALVDAGDSVSLRLLDSQASADTATRLGVRRLFMLQTQREIRAVLRSVPNMNQLAVRYAPVGPAAQLQDDLSQAMAMRALGEDRVIRTQAEFVEQAQKAWGQLHNVGQQTAQVTASILEQYQAVRHQLELRQPPAWQPSVNDMRQQVDRLVYPGFISQTPWVWLVHLPRYLHAVWVRMQKIGQGGLERDLDQMQIVAGYWSRYLQKIQANQQRRVIDPALERYRWMVEELRVSLFAQQLGTALPVSPKRLDAQWAQVRP